MSNDLSALFLESVDGEDDFFASVNSGQTALVSTTPTLGGDLPQHTGPNVFADTYVSQPQTDIFSVSGVSPTITYRTPVDPSSSSPQANSTQRHQHVSPTHVSQHGIPTHVPQHASSTHVPQPVSPTHVPQHVSPTHVPEHPSIHAFLHASVSYPTAPPNDLSQGGHGVDMSPSNLARGGLSFQRPTNTSQNGGHIDGVAFPQQQPAQVAPTSTHPQVSPTHVSPATSPTLTRPSLLSAMRNKKSDPSELIQPEQDVIYKQPTSSPGSLAPPPIMGREVRFMNAPSPPAGLHESPPSRLQPSAPVGARLEESPPSHPVLRGPFSGPISQPSHPVMRSPPAIQGPFEPQTMGPSTYFPDADSRRCGLKVCVSMGFGGRVVVAGGRFGMKVGLATMEQLLPTSPWLRDMQTMPGPLGSVSDLTTEGLLSWLGPKTDQSPPGLGAHPQFSWEGVSDSHLLASYLSCHLKSSKRRPGGTAEFASVLWQNSLVGISPGSSILFQFVAAVVAGQMQAAIALARDMPELHPFAMAVASIHSAEFFRESILLFADSIGVGAIPESLVQTEFDNHLLELLKVAITVFASTSPLHPVVSEAAVSNWKLYLALIGSLVKPGSVNQYLIRLGDALVGRRAVIGSQLCVMIGLSSIQLDSVDARNSALAMLTVDHKNPANIPRLLDSHALQASEILEYALRRSSADPSSFFVSLQPFKFAYASLLASDLGFFDLAERYLVVLAAFVRAVPTGRYSAHLRTAIRDLETRIADSKVRVNVHNAGHGGISDVGQAALGALWGGIKAVAQTSRMTR